MKESNGPKNVKVVIYSDLHLEFKHGWSLPEDLDADIMVLAGDIINFADYTPLVHFLHNWKKPVIFVPGNHEYYTEQPMFQALKSFRNWLAKELPYVILLDDSPTQIKGIHFFGGTMWTDFSQEDQLAMKHAQKRMSDFRYIKSQDQNFTPQESVLLHKAFLEKLSNWFEEDLDGTRVVITHHAPVTNLNTVYADSLLRPAFNSLDMLPLIKNYQPDLWVYGHTHECDDQIIGRTRILSNQLGYPNGLGGYECPNFDRNGNAIILQGNWLPE